MKKKTKKRIIRNPDAPIKAVLYCRVSTKEQVSNLSLETQQNRGIEYCERNGWTITQIFRDEGASAKSTDRPEFLKMLGYCNDAAHDISFVVVYDLSRFARQAADQITVMAELRACGIGLRSVTEDINETSSGKMLAGIKAVINQHENDLKAERTVAGMKTAASHGTFPFKAPLGYLNGDTATGGNIVHDPDRAPLVLKAFELFATGTKTKAQVLKIVNDLGLTTHKGHPVPCQTFQMILRNPLYMGIVSIPKWNVRHVGIFHPIVSNEIFEQVQTILDGRSQVVVAHLRNHPDFPLRVFTLCGKCGVPLTGSLSTGRNNRYSYYRCRNSACKALNMRSELMHQEFEELLLRLKPTERCLDMFRDAFRTAWKAHNRDSEELLGVVREKHRAAGERKNRLFDLMLEGRCQKRAFDEQLSRIEELERDTELELARLQGQRYDIDGLLEFATEVARQPALLWKESPLEQKQRLQSVFFPDGVTFADNAFGTAPSDSFFELFSPFEGVDASLASPTGFEPVLPP